MKTDIGVESRTRSDSRQNLSRRRVARDHTSSRLSENWAFDQNDLALAVQESLRYAKQAEKEKMLVEQSTHKKSENDAKSKMEEMILSGKICSDSQQGPKQLKELLLLHIDLAQHQQELLIQKDKEIKTLREERNALSCRLERMERRMSLLKQKEELGDVQSNHKTVSSPYNAQHGHSQEMAASAPTEKGTKRKSGSSFEPQNLNKRFAAEAQKECLSTGATQRTERHPSRQRSRSATVTSSAMSSLTDLAPTNTPSQKRNRRSTKSVKDIQVDNSVLRTKDNYFVSYYEPASSQDIDLECRGDIIKGAQSQLEVELPTWRHRNYTNLWVLEGTENLEDEIFLKRHQKPEVEEKRRKRWDLQRIREQKIYEKLKEKDKERGGEVYTQQQKDEDTSVESFYSDLDNITHIEVTDKIPVMAFGHPVPNIDQIDFNLPWELESVTRSHNSRSASRTARHR